MANSVNTSIKRQSELVFVSTRSTRTLTTSDEDSTNIHQVKQPGREMGNYSVPKTCPKAARARP
eukprot:3677801-Ditylum_brightwellii.AAC.1